MILYFSYGKKQEEWKDQTLIERLCNPNPVANARKGYRAEIIPDWDRERGNNPLEGPLAKDPTP